jgi:hypothetical protein
VKITQRTRDVLAYRKQQRELLALGWDHVPDPVWEIDRGGRWDEIIVDVKIATDGKSLYVKTAPRETD